MREVIFILLSISRNMTFESCDTKLIFFDFMNFVLVGVSTSASVMFYFHVVARQSIKKKEHFVV